MRSLHAPRPSLAAPIALSDGVGVAIAGDVLLVVWKGAANRERYDWFEACVWSMAEEHASFAICQFVMSSSRPPDARLRARTRETLVALGPRVRCVVSVPIGDVLWATVVRTIMRGVAILSGHSDTVIVAGSLNEALDRIRRVASAATPERAALAAAARDLGTALGVRLESTEVD
jgi:hypothetical protein